jgi:hypothetical protein
MHARIAIVLVTSLAAAPGGAPAQQQAGATSRVAVAPAAPAWTAIVDDERVRIELDSARVVREGAGRIVVWTRWRWREQRERGRLLGGDWIESLDHWDVDCRQRLYHERETRLFSAEGRELSRAVATPADSIWYELLPKSYGSAVVTAACRRYGAEPRAKPARRRGRAP